MTGRTALNILNEGFGSQMFVSEDGHITFSMPAQALKQTILGNPHSYQMASLLMSIAEADATVQKGRM